MSSLIYHGIEGDMREQIVMCMFLCKDFAIRF